MILFRWLSISFFPLTSFWNSFFLLEPDHFSNMFLVFLNSQLTFNYPRNVMVRWKKSWRTAMQKASATGFKGANSVPSSWRIIPFPLYETNSKSTWKWMVGRLCSLWEGLFSGANWQFQWCFRMVVSGYKPSFISHVHGHESKGAQNPSSNDHHSC